MIKPEVIRIVIKTISPVHIGSGTEYYPMDYLPVKDNGKISGLCFYDQTALSDVISKDGEKFNKYCETVKKLMPNNKSNMDRFYDFISPYVKDLPRSSGCAISSSAAAKLNGSASTTPIAALIKNQYLKEPYIPGSAVKGMLKNIMYWKYYKDKEIKRLDEKRDFPERDKDPWRLVQVSDFLPVQCAWYVDLLANLHKQKKGADSRTLTGIPVLSELIDAGSIFIGTLTFNNALYKEASDGNDDFSREVKKFFPESLNKTNLRDAVKDYGKCLFDKENKVFNSGGNFALKNRFEKWWNLHSSGEAYENARFIKLGKHAGAISKMVYGGDDFFKGERNVSIPQQKGKTARNDTQTTVWLSSEGIPLGWATMQIGMAEEGWNVRLEQREKFIKEPHNFIAPRAEQKEARDDKKDIIDRYKRR